MSALTLMLTVVNLLSSSLTILRRIASALTAASIVFINELLTSIISSLPCEKTLESLRKGAVEGSALENFSRTHSVEDLPVQYWDYASMIGMCSNVQIVFYRNRKDEVIVKFLYNEKETTVPALTPAYGKYFYSWDSLRKYYTEKLK